MSVAADTIGALRGSPNLLLVFLLNAVFIGALFFYLVDERRGREGIVNKLFDRCLPDVHSDAYVHPQQHPDSEHHP